MGEGAAADDQAARPPSHNASRSNRSRSGSSSRVDEGAAADGQVSRPTSNNASRSSCSSSSGSSSRVGDGAAADDQAAQPTSNNASRSSSTLLIRERRNRHNRSADKKKYRLAAEGRLGKTGDASSTGTQLSAVNE